MATTIHRLNSIRLVSYEHSIIINFVRLVTLDLHIMFYANIILVCSTHFWTIFLLRKLDLNCCRTFWFVCSILCWWASASVITSAWNSYQNNAVSFVVNTNYRDWNTQFSAVYVCERNNEDKVAEISDQ